MSPAPDPLHSASIEPVDCASASSSWASSSGGMVAERVIVDALDVGIARQLGRRRGGFVGAGEIDVVEAVDRRVGADRDLVEAGGGQRRW